MWAYVKKYNIVHFKNIYYDFALWKAVFFVFFLFENNRTFDNDFRIIKFCYMDFEADGYTGWIVQILDICMLVFHIHVVNI